MGMFEKLAAYKIQHKNTVVPQQYEKDPKLHNVDIIKKVTYIRIESIFWNRLILTGMELDGISETKGKVK